MQTNCRPATARPRLRRHDDAAQRPPDGRGCFGLLGSGDCLFGCLSIDRPRLRCVRRGALVGRCITWPRKAVGAVDGPSPLAQPSPESSLTKLASKCVVRRVGEMVHAALNRDRLIVKKGIQEGWLTRFCSLPQQRQAGTRQPGKRSSRTHAWSWRRPPPQPQCWQHKSSRSRSRSSKMEQRRGCMTTTTTELTSGLRAFGRRGVRWWKKGWPRPLWRWGPR